MADRQTDDFKLGNKAADMWLYTADACANEKVIPKKYRYTTGTALMNGAEAICSCIEGANLIDLRERPAERLFARARSWSGRYCGWQKASNTPA